MWFKKRKRLTALSMLGLDDLMSLCSHLFLIGGSGSGKTSAMKIIMAEILDRGVGCVWGCVKSDEAENAISVINSTSMELGSKARSAAVSQCNALLSPFLLSPMYETVCGESVWAVHRFLTVL